MSNDRTLLELVKSHRLKYSQSGLYCLNAKHTSPADPKVMALQCSVKLIMRFSLNDLDGFVRQLTYLTSYYFMP